MDGLWLSSAQIKHIPCWNLKWCCWIANRFLGAGEREHNRRSFSPRIVRKPVISGDGRFVVFGSRASDLVTNDLNNYPDIFVRDRLLGTTMLISRNVNGTSGNAASMLRPIMAADGRTVVFHSMASDLVEGGLTTTSATSSF
jgi:Tol biopolymer transport system component